MISAGYVAARAAEWQEQQHSDHGYRAYSPGEHADQRPQQAADKSANQVDRRESHAKAEGERFTRQIMDTP
jgi:hypothetical protein